MILVNLLAVSVLISLAKSMPYHRRNANQMVIQAPYRKENWGSEDYYEDSPQYEQTGTPKIDNSESSNVRQKKIGSLSITNPMDVLRQRYLLELARRQQMQQQEQAKVNREILNDIGKRAIGHYKMIYPSIQTRNNQVLSQSFQQAPSNKPNWSPLDWYDVGNSVDRSDETDQSNKMETNEIQML